MWTSWGWNSPIGLGTGSGFEYQLLSQGGAGAADIAAVARGLVFAANGDPALGHVFTTYSAATPQNATIPSETRDIVFTTVGLSSLETIIPTGLPNTPPPISVSTTLGLPDAAAARSVPRYAARRRAVQIGR